MTAPSPQHDPSSSRSDGPAADRDREPLGLLLGGALILVVALLLLASARKSHVPPLARAVHTLVDGDVNHDQRWRLIETVRDGALSAAPTDRRAAWQLWSAGLALGDSGAVEAASTRLGVRSAGPAAGLPLLAKNRAAAWARDPRQMELAALGEPTVLVLLRCAAAATAGDLPEAERARAAAAVSAELFRLKDGALAQLAAAPAGTK